ncbi:MAG: hypothetical protein RRY12_10955 [Cloacibacillus sp.]
MKGNTLMDENLQAVRKIFAIRECKVKGDLNSIVKETIAIKETLNHFLDAEANELYTASPSAAPTLIVLDS